MNIYADRGNIAVLRARCEWRGHRVRAPGGHDRRRARPRRARPLLHGRRPGPRPGRGGRGHGRDQARRAARGRRPRRGRARRCAAATSCSAHSYQLGDEKLPGVGLVDLQTVREPGERLIGNCAIEADLGTGRARSPASRTTAGAPTWARTSSRSGRVLSGHGNNGKDGYEGVRRGNVIGTYLHGPLLPKNVWLADRLIELALGIELEPLDDRLEDAAHASRAAGRGRLGSNADGRARVRHRRIGLHRRGADPPPGGRRARGQRARPLRPLGARRCASWAPSP